MERASVLIASEAWAGRDCQDVYLCMNVCMSVSVKCKGRKGVWGCFILRLMSFKPVSLLLSLLAYTYKVLDRLTVVGMLVSSSLDKMLSVSTSGFRVLLVTQDCKVPQVHQETLVRGWVKVAIIVRLIKDVFKKLLFSPRYKSLKYTCC